MQDRTFTTATTFTTTTTFTTNSNETTNKTSFVQYANQVGDYCFYRFADIVFVGEDHLFAHIFKAEKQKEHVYKKPFHKGDQSGS